MKCLIGSQTLGAWCRLIHTLAQVGDDEIYFDFAETIMTISTTNSSLSTFSSVLLFRGFFGSYSMTSDAPEKVALPAKIILKPYRSQKMAKNHTSSEIQYTADADHILIKSESKSRVSSSYRLSASVHDEEIQFECDPYVYPHSVKIDAKVLSNCLSNFSHMKGLAELSLKIHGSRVTLRNTVTDVTRKDGSVVTEYNLTYHDFLEFKVGDEDIELIFGYREFKIFTSMAEQLKLPVELFFKTPLDPVVIVVKSDLFEARLCMATRLNNDPFVSTPNSTVNGGATGPSLGSDGRISNVTTQSSGRSGITPSISSISSGVPQERNRNRGTVSRSSVAVPSVTNPAPPPSKRARRTEAAPPQPQPIFVPTPPPAVDDVEDIELGEDATDMSRFAFQNFADDPVEDQNVNTNNNTGHNKIADLVERLENQNKSKGYKAIKRILAQPRMTEEEYLKTIPGHDIILCPDSDEEADASSSSSSS